MFASVLVANRGEIACRIFRTAKRLGVRTVAVFSDADAKAKHVREADSAHRLGPAPAAESYLRGDLILEIARQAGVEAIHPGYGFLSENPAFAEAVMAAGITWIGPTPDAIRAMGLKDEAKRIAIEAGVPVLAGYQGEDQSEKRLLKAAKDIGFPVLIKAVAGGGGRGIREVHTADAFGEQLTSAKREAKAAFGNDVVLVEKLVQRPRHIEVQVFGDSHGNVVHLFERDCSLQRRRQKVIEEAPAPGMTAGVRDAMTDAAVKLAKAVGYQNAGTVEFIVDGTDQLRDDGFWFLEMNTRLQVEHPVTEMITGLDLVEWQFRVATGEALPCQQADISLTGHAIEARICAEDPSENFRPSVGRLRHCRWPKGGSKKDKANENAVRVDVGFDVNDTVPSAYDSMVGKIIVWSADAASDGARDRAGAIALMRAALEDLEIEGVQVNAHFLHTCLQPDGAFAAGIAQVGTIGESLEALTDVTASRHTAAAALVASQLAALRRDPSPWASADGWRLNATAAPTWRFESDDQTIMVEAGDAGIIVNGVPVALTQTRGRPKRHTILARGAESLVFVNGALFPFSRPGARADAHAGEGGNEIKAPLPGKIVALVAKPGDAVKKGDGLLTMEAMKMEHALKAPRDGVVAEVNTEVGEQVKEGAVLLRLEGDA